MTYLDGLSLNLIRSSWFFEMCFSSCRQSFLSEVASNSSPCVATPRTLHDATACYAPRFFEAAICSSACVAVTRTDLSLSLSLSVCLSLSLSLSLLSLALSFSLEREKERERETHSAQAQKRVCDTGNRYLGIIVLNEL